jgi:hypothetical protein
MSMDASGPTGRIGSVKTATEGDGGGSGVAGVTSVNGLAGAVLLKPTIRVATVAGLAITPSADANGHTLGDIAWIDSVGDDFQLRTSALTVDGITVVAANGRAGCQWVRMGIRNPKWEAQATWAVDPQNSTALASDENTGLNAAAPLRSYAELARRLVNADLAASGVVVSVLSNRVTTDNPSFTCRGQVGAIRFEGVPTTLFTGAITTWTPAVATTAADDNQLTDNSVPVSFTASGMLADGVLFKRTNGTAAYWYAAKDLGTKKIRTSTPVDLGGSGIALANADTYVAQTLPTIGALRFPLMPIGVTYRFLNHVDSANPIGSILQYSHTWRTAGGGQTIGTCTNGAFNATCNTFSGRGGFSLTFTKGMLRSAAGTTVWVMSGMPSVTLNGLTIQGGGVRTELAPVAAAGERYSIYDCTAAICFEVSTGSHFDYPLAGCTGGKGNTGVFNGVSKGGAISYLPAVATVWTAACSTNPNQISVEGTGYALGALPAAPQIIQVHSFP